MYKKQKTWEDAKQHCINTQSNLTSIHSEEENKFIGKCDFFKCVYWHLKKYLVIKNGGDHIWTGLYFDTIGKRWRWIEDGSEATFSNWDAGRPTKLLEDDRMDMTVSYKWHNHPRHLKEFFVCKRKL